MRVRARGSDSVGYFIWHSIRVQIMAKKEYSFYPGCSSERKASAANYMVSVESMCKTLDIKLNEIPDWNCCGASIGYAEGGELPRHIMNARNIALSEQHNPKQDIVATCAACWLGTKETQERISHSGQLLADVNDILKDAGLKYEGKQPVRHMVEVLIEDLGYDELKKPVVKPLEGIKIAGYVGCQTNRPFGVDGESFENPKYLDKLVETVGGEAVEKYDQKVTCCGGALAFSEPEKSQAQIKKIIESAYDYGAEMIVTPCPVCQMNVEVYQGQINKKYNTKFNIPVVYYSQLMAVAYGANAKEAGLDGNIVRATKLEEIAAKK
jgi:heterodisulfide reductase subunit B